MRALLLAAALGVVAAPAAAQHAGHAQHGEHAQHGAPAAPSGDETPPAAAFEGPPHAADALFDPATMAAARGQLRHEQGGMRVHKVMLDRLEARLHEGRDGYAFEGDAWYGGDIDKLWLKGEGEGAFGEKPEAVELQALWSHAITPWFDLQAGLRYDFRPDPERAHLVLGAQGLAPYFVEIDAAAFLSDEGDATARIEAEYDQLITQRLILQPRVEAALSAREVEEIELGSGLTSVEAGLRLRYEFVPEFAPYLGVAYERKLGGTADFARDDGEDPGQWSLLIGVRAWF